MGILKRSRFLRGMLRPVWIRVAGPVWGLVAFYDTFLSQVVPERLAKVAPKLSGILFVMAPLLPWWGWLLIFAAILVVALFEYAFRLFVKLEVAEARIVRLETAPDREFSPLEILFEVRVEDDGRVERIYLGVKNNGETTIYNVTVRAHDSTFARDVICLTHHTNDSDPIMVEFDHIDPGSREVVRLFGINYGPPMGIPSLQLVQPFTLEARARNISSVRRNFIYDPDRRPMIRPN